MSLAVASVLAVDDNATIRRAIAMRLTSNGYRVSTAEDGLQALAALDVDIFDLMLLDLQMPGMRGDEVLKRVRHRFSDTELPIIMLAASDDKNDISRALQLGANDYVIKPGDLPILLARIKTQLSLKKVSARVQEQALRLNHSNIIEFSANTGPSINGLQPDALDAGFNVGINRRYGLLYDNTPMTCFTLNRDFEVIFANRFGAQALGYSQTDLRAESGIGFYPESDQATAMEYLQGVLDQPGKIHRWEIRRRKKDGSTIWMRETARLLGEGSEALILMTCEDIDDAYKLSKKLAHFVSHDELTGLANRKVLEDRLTRVIESAHSEQSQHTLAILDIDQFKIINDTSGHIAGDELLKQAARLLNGLVRKRDTLSRIGGDEFGILFEDCTLEQSSQTIEAARETLSNLKFEWNGTAHRISASVGLVRIDRQCESSAAALSMADTACYAAKDAGRNRTHIYAMDDAGLVDRHGQMRWATRINDALRDDRFELCLQPIIPVDLDVNQGEHFEILIRMRDERGDLVLPGEFLPAAERYDLAAKIDRWVIRNTLDWLRGNPNILSRVHLCSINLSGRSFGDSGMLKFILDSFDNDEDEIARKICFEVTETAAISDIVHASNFIETLKARGCYFALDDFGSGFSSFAYLKNLPVDFVKIDGSFVRGMARDSIDMAMVRSINEIGHVLGKKTTAEFVENQDILSALRTLGVDYAQGYEIGRPRPISDFFAPAVCAVQQAGNR